MESNGGRSGKGRNSEQGSGKAAVEECRVDPVVEPKRLNQQTAETEREGSDGETTQNPVNAGRRGLGRGAGQPRRNPQKSDPLGQPADRNPVPAGLQGDRNREEDHRERKMDG